VVRKRSVLVVDRSEENREVLRTALERRGVTFLEASRTQRGLELARQHHPDLIVLDLECSSATPEEVCRPFAQEIRHDHTPLVVIGNIRRGSTRPSQAEIVTKPYHFGHLIRKIEELLDAGGQVLARCA
jgi:CheY-like chemotaxis protein